MNRVAKEALTFLAMVGFFGGSLLFSRGFIDSSSSTWDYIALYTVKMMSGLGLGVVLVLGIVRLREGITRPNNTSSLDLKRYK